MAQVYRALRGEVEKKMVDVSFLGRLCCNTTAQRIGHAHVRFCVYSMENPAGIATSFFSGVSSLFPSEIG